jgi:DNA-binding transcriptional MocR family regulator
MLKDAVAHQVAYVPGGAFYVEQKRGAQAMRLNFSNAQPDRIVEGCRRLGELLKEKILLGHETVATAA